MCIQTIDPDLLLCNLDQPKSLITSIAHALVATGRTWPGVSDVISSDSDQQGVIDIQARALAEKILDSLPRDELERNPNLTKCIRNDQLREDQGDYLHLVKAIGCPLIVIKEEYKREQTGIYRYDIKIFSPDVGIGGFVHLISVSNSDNDFSKWPSSLQPVADFFNKIQARSYFFRRKLVFDVSQNGRSPILPVLPGLILGRGVPA
jgi:hypothetical protein